MAIVLKPEHERFIQSQIDAVCVGWALPTSYVSDFYKAIDKYIY